LRHDLHPEEGGKLKRLAVIDEKHSVGNRLFELERASWSGALM
jgi:hypothetical protein